uniref:Methionyl-tRNA synthetase n=1 Tax=Ditylenchus dipsaci TaxID=166011 RepID=A0A915ELN5_9BILA
MCATEYLNYEDKKFSKSRNTGVFGDSVSTIGIQADVWRFYLVYMRPESQDTAFCWDDFMAKVNSELNDNLGNFVQRSLTFVFNHFQGVIPAMKMTPIEDELFLAVNKELAEYTKNLESVKLKNALVGILSISRLGNQYIQANKPWLAVKGTEKDKQRAATVVAVAANLSMLLSTTFYPFMPEASKQIRQTCNIQQSIRLPNAFIQFLVDGHTISKPVPLFPKLEEASIKEWKVRFGAVSQGKTESKGSKKEDMSVKSVAVEPDSNFPKLALAQKNIDTLVETISKKLEKAKSLFVDNELEKLDAINQVLKQQVLDLKKQMGVDDGLIKALDSIKPTTTADTSENKKAVPKKDPTSVQTKKTEKKEPIINSGGGVKPVSDEEVDVGRLDMRVGRILEVKKHPDADSLYVETIDLGEASTRTVVSGLVKHVPLEQMQNRLVVCLCNLKPAKMRGVESQAMVMCASSPDKVEIMEVDPSCIPGDVVEYGTFIRRPDAVLNPKKKIWEAVAVDLKVSQEGVAVYKDQVLTIKQKQITAPTLKNVPMK